ncbi:hypothetical protein KKG71_02760 [Patescibacteria group bacterium]|nr:hypothetical protein [Patescibacteria group bacterium]
MSKKSDQQFTELLETAKTDPNIIGFFLGGSRGKGFENELSDYDPLMIVNDEMIDAYKKKYEDMKFEDIDLSVISLSNFKTYAEWGSSEEWDRYDFSHVQVQVDKNGEIQKIVNEKGVIPDDKRDNFVRWSIDSYINHVFRSVKCIRNKNKTGARLAAYESIPNFLNVIFALEGRIKPFNDYLEKELEQFPLKKLPIKRVDLLEKILAIINSADLSTQQNLLKMVEDVSRKEGFGQTFDDWEGKDKWAMEFRP